MKNDNKKLTFSFRFHINCLFSSNFFLLKILSDCLNKWNIFIKNVLDWYLSKTYTVPETFYFHCALTILLHCVHHAFTMHSLALFGRSFRTHRSRSAHCVLPQCFHIAFNLHSPFIQCSCIVQSVDIKFRLIAIHTCILLFFPDLDKMLE